MRVLADSRHSSVPQHHFTKSQVDVSATQPQAEKTCYRCGGTGHISRKHSFNLGLCFVLKIRGER